MERNSSFQSQVKSLGELVCKFEAMADTPEKATAKELLQLLMEVNGSGLERMLEMVFETGAEGAALIDKLARDEMVSGLLLLYSLHPEALEERIRKAMDGMRSLIAKHAYSIELLGIEHGAVRVSLNAAGHSCGSTAQAVKAIVENNLYQAAPDMTSLEIVEVQNPAQSGFVAVESLAGSGRTHVTKPAATQDVASQHSVLA